MERTSLKREISRYLGGRQLVFFGTRGDDAEGVGDQPELAAVFSLIAAHHGRAAVQSTALEDLTGERVDLDTYDIDQDLHREEVVELRRAMLRILWKASVVFTYRPSTFLSAICFARQDRCLYAGMFKDHQTAFEHKPWVESSVRAMGIPAIPWTYVADEDQLDALPFLADGPIVLRRSRSTGGTGLYRIESATELEALWPEQDEAFVSVAPFIPNGIPTNVSGVVWPDGVTLHGASVQLIGVPGLTTRPFGYCGNDFGAARDLPPRTLREMEASTMGIGRWLASHGYRGAFGVDFLVDGERALFTEINPRLQGVTHLACQASASAGESCVLLEHLAASLGMSAPPSPPLAEQVARTEPLAHVVFHRPEPPAMYSDGQRVADQLLGSDGVERLDVICPPHVAPQPGATIARATLAARVTVTGLDLIEPWATRISGATMVPAP